MRGYLRSQGGYTLVEVIVASAVGAILMTGLTSVILTSIRSSDIATSRIEASSQIRSFQFFAGDDFRSSGVPSASGCGTRSTPCTTQSIVLTGPQVTNSTNPVPLDSVVGVTYTWDGSSFVNRQLGTGSPIRVATGVTAFSWYVDSSGAFPTVVVSLTVAVSAYSESQTLLFYPRLNP
jgi:prepilin-type N-terminal cleavage/methylation domain-containing protein